LRTLAASPIPLVAALTGHAPAGGTVLALYCDYRILAEGNWKIGLNEVRVGLTLPPVIFAALRRQVGPREAERLATAGLLLPPAEALRVGLVEELAPPEQTVPRAIEWCESLLALPATALLETRQMARADLVRLFDPNLEAELAVVFENWWSAETQTVLRGLVERLAQKKQSA
ncbi:MAG TPA: enoyl-CoA hydratase/isomerase family protein, partial [Thermoanaerobaculia bacterium]|nr:enoyl-CoA hydratase/isomerase family protein [Thermoanaerobaculia bacterium]